MSKHTKGRQNDSSKELVFPWTLWRPLFGILSMILFLVCLHSLIYVLFIALKTPDCSQCDEQKEEKNCYNFCDTTVDDFVFVYDLEDRIAVLTYVEAVLFLRCIAFLAGFIGVFTFLFYAMIVYLVLHFGLINSFLATLIFYAVEENSFLKYSFGRTTISMVLLSIEYILELILFILGLSISYKFFRLKRTKTSEEKNEKRDKTRENIANTSVKSEEK